MLARSAVVLGLLAALSAAGCGGQATGAEVASAGGSAKPSAAASAVSGDEAALKYSKCMRENGVPSFPDPDPNGGLDLDLDKVGVSKATVDAATGKCKQYLPNGGAPQKIDPERLELSRQFARCMRENGVPKFPDPDADGGIALDPDKIGMDPTGPAMKAAEKACEKYLGPGGGERSVTNK